MAYDDDDEWPEPERDPEKLAIARERLEGMRATSNRVLRYTYAGLALIVLVLVLILVLR
jgi:hypothetical protein